MRFGLEQLTSHAQTSMRDVLSFIFSAQAPLGGICLHLPDNQFDLQPALSLLPKALLAPFEMMLTICMTTLSDPNKELVVGLLAEACCERLERFISQVRRGRERPSVMRSALGIGKYQEFSAAYNRTTAHLVSEHCSGDA